MEDSSKLEEKTDAPVSNLELLKTAYKNHNVIDPDLLIACLNEIFGVEDKDED